MRAAACWIVPLTVDICDGRLASTEAWKRLKASRVPVHSGRSQGRACRVYGEDGGAGSRSGINQGNIIQVAAIGRGGHGTAEGTGDWKETQEKQKNHEVRDPNPVGIWAVRNSGLFLRATGIASRLDVLACVGWVRRRKQRNETDRKTSQNSWQRRELVQHNDNFGLDKGKTAPFSTTALYRTSAWRP